uniref:Phospholipid-binding protein, PBP family n=1 Tax=Candidatus Kentrum eta TaxID=2126337 RepID=A0A450VLQ4_9GAMM|nr:MAG: phospholipid-binding protein, PBP family [Candidatus Kentron sp. H]VFK05723.1 MAG: phospholipid-binding protein, PBP family [Candidatus Kentron sp. H]VFK09111.1 MAG: phospholipid-binding protein, PBP family [Candidatus Kentron sp. H]
MTFSLQSEAFIHNGEIPEKYTCEGQDISPPLHWRDAPGETKSLVLIVDDPDAPDPKDPKMTWVHWVLYNLPPEAEDLSEAMGNATGSAQLPPGTGEGTNDWGRTRYGGPCPPIGRHRYFHKLYALDTVLEGMDDEPDKDELEDAMAGHVLAKAELVGTYQKKR